MLAERRVGRVLGVPIDALAWEEAEARILDWAGERSSRYVVICNVHVTVTAARGRGYGRLIADADMVTPDGAPVAWMLRRQGFSGQPRISGPDLMARMVEICAEAGIGMYFYGSATVVLEQLTTNLRASHPEVIISGADAPPFRPLTTEEDEAAVRRINDSGAGIVFVGLGCPKQEQWMAAHRGRVNAVMIGVGAAFDFHAGTVRRAPLWMRNAGLEWLHRLASEPRRLWRRYLVTNTFFLWGAFLQLTGLGYRRTP